MKMSRLKTHRCVSSCGLWGGSSWCKPYYSPQTHSDGCVSSWCQETQVASAFACSRCRMATWSCNDSVGENQYQSRMKRLPGAGVIKQYIIQVNVFYSAELDECTWWGSERRPYTLWGQKKEIKRNVCTVHYSCIPVLIDAFVQIRV